MINGNKDAARLAENAWVLLLGRLSAILSAPILAAIFGWLLWLGGAVKDLQSDQRNAETIRRYSTVPRIEALERNLHACCGRSYSRIPPRPKDRRPDS